VWPLVLVIGRLQQQLRQPGDVKGDVIDLEIRNAPLVRHDRSSTNRKTAAATPAIIPVADYWSRYWLGSAWAGVNSGWVVSRPCMAGLTDRHAAQSVAFPVKAYASRLGLDADAYSGHSLRSGFLTSAATRGALLFNMMDVSRHKSVDVLRGYVRDAEAFRHHAGQDCCGRSCNPEKWSGCPRAKAAGGAVGGG
jgi:hypothetical protein